MSQEDVLLRRLAKCHAEACKEIEASVKAGRSLGDAVLDAIEALPPSKTRDLRRWLEDWEAWEEWEKYEAKGWRVKKVGGRVYAFAPSHQSRIFDGPGRAATAAGAGVQGELLYVGDSTGHGSYIDPPAAVVAAVARSQGVSVRYYDHLISQYSIKRS
jgi:hypothetical protein